MVTLRYQLEVSSKTAPSQDVNFGWIRRFRVDGRPPGHYTRFGITSGLAVMRELCMQVDGAEVHLDFVVVEGQSIEAGRVKVKSAFACGHPRR